MGLWLYRPRRRSAVLVGGCVVLVALPCARAVLCASPSAASTVASLPAKGTIRLDGVLDEPDWGAGRWYQGFTRLSEAPEVPEAATRFKLRHDNRCLYLGAVLDEPAVGKIQARVTQRDGKVWSDDCVELMIDPTGQRVEHYHFAVNARGALYDAWVRQGGQVSTSEWNSTAVAAARVGEGSWSVEMAIPLNELGLTKASLGKWAVNVARERQAGTKELSTFAPLQGGFHQPTLYPAMELQGADLRPYLWDLRLASAPKTVRKAGSLTSLVDVRLTNQTGSSRRVQLRCLLEAADAKTKGPGVDSELAHGQEARLSCRVPVSVQGRQLLRLSVVDPRKPDSVWCVRAHPVDLRYEPLRLRITRPCYRGSIYATQQIENVEVACDVDEEPAALAGAVLHVRLVRQDGSVACESKIDAVPGSRRVSLSAKDLPIGDHRIEARVVGPDGKVLHSAAQRLRKLAKVAHEYRIDPCGVLLHNGKPFLPFGWFSIPASEMAKPDCPYTAMQAYSSYWYNVEKVRKSLDAVAEAGTVVTIYPYPYPKMVSPASIWGQPLTDKEVEDLRQRVRALKDHPALMAWYMADEPELRPALPERCRRIYEVVADEDPYHPCIMLNDTIKGIADYADGGDVLMPDPYPLFVKGAHAGQPIEKVTAFMKAAARAAGAGRAVWITPQAFNYGDYGRANNRAPSFAELRNMTYQAAIAGTKGWLWYTWSHTQNYPALALGMPWLAREVADLKDAILASNVAGAFEVTADLPDHVHACVRRTGKHWYIFVVNTATRPQKVRFRLKPSASPVRLNVIAEARHLVATDGWFEDRFGLYETHLYATDAEVAFRRSVADVETKIRKANAARRRPGNLAFEDNGAKVTFSSKSTYGSTPDRVVDGVRDGMQWKDGTPGKCPDWLAVEWPKPVKIARVVVYSRSIGEAKIQVRSTPDGDWRTVGSVKDVASDRFDVEFPVTTVQVVRVWITANRTGQRLSQITELEAYGTR